MTPLDYALLYISLGWRVFPCWWTRPQGTLCACGKKTCSNAGKHPLGALVPKGCLDASDDESVVRSWWQKYPDANIAIATGGRLVVVDIDPRHGGDEGFDDLIQRHGRLPDTVEAITGGGGRHLYALLPEGRVARNSAGDLAPGVDVRGEGGYVMAPPSSHVSGGSYAWESSSDPTEGVELAVLSGEWLDIIAPAERPQAQRGAVAQAPTVFGEGKRNNFLFSTGRSMRALGASEDSILASLRVLNQQCDPPLDDAEVVRTAQSAAKKPPGLSPEYQARKEAAAATRSTSSPTVEGATAATIAARINEKEYLAREVVEIAATLEPIEFERVKDTIKLAKLPVRPFLAAVAAAAERNAKQREVRNAEERVARAAEGGTPTILVGPDEERVNDEGVVALSTHKDAYQRGGVLVHVVHDHSPLRGLTRPKSPPRIVPMAPATLREMLATSAVWVAKFDDGPRRVSVPKHTVSAIHERKQWNGVRVLEAVIDCPVLRPDGSVIREPGYDLQTGLLYTPEMVFPEVPESPSRDDARRALQVIDDLFTDFPFRAEAHRSAALAAVLTPLASYAIRGPKPLFLFDANTAGAGKGKCVSIVSEIVQGRAMAVMAPTEDEEETRKRIMAIALSGEPLTLIDNIEGVFGGPSLDAAITATEVSDRILGDSKMVRMPLLTTWFATGNNVSFRGDMQRRVVRVRLESPEAHPEDRRGFKYDDVEGYARAHRAELVVAALTALRAFKLSKPRVDLRPWGSFAGWSDLIRGTLVWCGFADPSDTREELRDEADITTGALTNLLMGWADVAKRNGGYITAGQMLRTLDLDEREAATTRALGYAGFREALAELVPGPPGRLPSARAVGAMLRRHKGRVVRCHDGVARALVAHAKGADGAVWCVRSTSASVHSADSDDSADSVPRSPLHRFSPKMEIRIEEENKELRSESSESSESAQWTESLGGVAFDVC